MSKEMVKTEDKKIVLADLTPDVVSEWKLDQLNMLLNQEPNPQWVKVHQYIRGYRYLPIERIEWLLKKILKRHKIEITGQGQSFNGVWVTVRVHFLHPILQEWDYHDGIGAEQLQLRAQTDEEKDNDIRVNFEPTNINNGALSMAYPIAKTKAIKDACDHFGNLFGANLNRKENIPYQNDPNLNERAEDRVKAIVDACETTDDLIEAFDTVPEQFHYLIEEKLEELKNDKN